MKTEDIDLSTYKEAFFASPIAKALVLPEGNWLEVNNTLPELVGYTRDELQHMTFQDITHPDDLEKDLNLVQQMLDKKIDTYKLEKRYIHKKGHTVWVLLSVTLVWDGENPKYFISQIVDISELKETQHKLQAKINELEKLNNEMIAREVRMAELKKEIESAKT